VSVTSLVSRAAIIVVILHGDILPDLPLAFFCFLLTRDMKDTKRPKYFFTLFSLKVHLKG
jgi:hypothetical protein